MREFTGNLAGESLTLKADFKASIEIATKVGDPLMIARESNLEAMMLANGITYNPDWSFTVENVPVIIFIGLRGAKTLEEVQELVFEAGFVEARELALEYLAMIIGPQPETVPDEDKATGDAEGN